MYPSGARAGSGSSKKHSSSGTVASSKQSKETVASSKQSKETVASSKQSKETVASSKPSKETVASSKQSKETVASSKPSKETVASSKQSKETVASSKPSKETVASSKPSKERITPFHRSPLSKNLGADVLEEPLGRSNPQTVTSSTSQTTAVTKSTIKKATRPVIVKTLKTLALPENVKPTNKIVQTKAAGASAVKFHPVVKKRKRKLGQYNLVPKKKVKGSKPQEKKEQPAAEENEHEALNRHEVGNAPAHFDPLSVGGPLLAHHDPPSVGSTPLAHSDPSSLGGPPLVHSDPPSVGSPPLNHSDPPSVGGPPLAHSDPGLAPVDPPLEMEYTEMDLECLDLRSQEALLSPQNADAQVTDSDLAEELPLCCCRMETPYVGGSLSAQDYMCMAMESYNGLLSRCQRRVLKQEMMRPSNTVHLLVLCEDHRAGMVKHQCCPGCGLFCRAGTFMECRPYGNISHRFHRDCASFLRDRRFCPHCGEDATGAKEVTMTKMEPSPSVPKSSPGPSLPSVPQAVCTIPQALTTTPAVPHALTVTPAVPQALTTTPAICQVLSTTPAVPQAMSTTPAVPQTLRAKKTVQPPRERTPGRPRGDADRPRPSLETILSALEDDNLKPKKVKYPARQLYVSSKQGDLQKVLTLLVEGKDPNFVDVQSKRTPLHAAAAIGNQEICHVLIQAGANLEVFDEDQRTPLMLSCENNHLDTVKYLLRAGAMLGHKDILGFTCLHLVAKLGHYTMMQYLLCRASKHINCQDDGGWTPVTWAIEYKHKEIVNLLLSQGADVNIRDKEENICLHWAALSGCDDVAQTLLEAHCDLTTLNIHGDLPLHIAARENHLDCVMLFLSRGADVNQRNKVGETPLDCCIYGSKVWTALNTNKKLTDARRGRDPQGERVLCRDISRGYEAMPISCVNGVDGEGCPDDFKYIPENCITSMISIDTDITRLQSCSCSDDCSSVSCSCGKLSLRCWYDSDGRLPLDFSQREPQVLFECNAICSCWRSCRNRVVQNGLRVRLQVYRTQAMGWGVRALQDVPAGAFICEYVGEIVTDAEADKREDDSFLFTLGNKVGEAHCIDSRRFGNVGRFLNHLCEPNLVAVKVFTTHQDQRFPRIALFSSRPIRAGHQIG